MNYRAKRPAARFRRLGSHVEPLEARTLLSGPGDIEWLRQFGSSLPQSASGRAVDAEGNVYVAGKVAGALPGQTSAGSFDAVVTKYDAAGNELWSRQFGTLADDSVEGIAADSSGVYVAGLVFGTLPGQTGTGRDAFVRKYDLSGNEVWTKQFGTNFVDAASAVAVDASGVYVTGYTEGILDGQAGFPVPNAFIRKYDASGSPLWTRQFETAAPSLGLNPEDRGPVVSASESGIYAAWSRPVQNRPDAFLRRYTADGVEVWTRQLAHGGAGLVDVGADASGVYLVGGTVSIFPGQSNFGLQDAYVRRYDASGNDVWTRQFGTAASDSAFAVALDDSGVYVAGSTTGTLAGQASAGSQDAFVRKYDTLGTEVWTHQFGTPGSDLAFGLAADSGGVYVAGTAAGTLGQAGTESPQVFLRKYESGGNEVWTRQFRAFLPVPDLARAVDADGNVYVAGELSGLLPGEPPAQIRMLFVRKYDPAGSELWTQRFGTSSFDRLTGIAVDASGVYAAGSTLFALPGQTSAGNRDAFVRKYDAAGNEMWTRQFGTSNVDQGMAISLDPSGIYIAGFTAGAFAGQTSAGGDDAFIRKYDASGSQIWTRQFGTASVDQSLGVAAHAAGVFVAGNTSGALPGQTSAGGQDAFVRVYDADGSIVWTRQFGNAGLNAASSVAASASGVYVAGHTLGSLGGQTSAGGQDAFVRAYDAGGAERWTRLLGTAGVDQAHGIAVSPSGVYVVGAVAGALPGQISAGGQDAFVRKYDPDGATLWTRQFGTVGTDAALGVNSGAAGLYAAGLTTGTFPGQTGSGLEDVFLAKITDEVTNTPPTNVALSLNAAVDEGGTATLSGAFVDSDGGDTHTVVINWGPGEGTTTLNLAAGVTTFSATHTYLDDAPPGTSSDVYIVTATVTEAAGNSASGSASITVSNVPPTAGSNAAATNEDQAVSIAVLANDSDIAGSLDPLAITSVTSGLQGTTAIDSKGTPQTTDDEIVYTPNPGASGSDTFMYTISDGDGGTATATVSVQIQNLVDVSGRVFDDKDNDGTYEPADGDIGIGGVSVQLFDESASILIATQMTAADGSYFFDANLIGGTYKVIAAQPAGFLDGRETAGNLGGTVDNAQDHSAIGGINIGQPGTTADAVDYLFARILPSQGLGLVWSDFNNDGEVNFGEKAIPGVTIELTGLDDRGNAVSRSTTTDANGVYAFLDLRPSGAAGYTIRELQPAGFGDGRDIPGTVNGEPVGVAAVNDTFTGVVLPKPNSLAENFNFGERPAADGGVQHGQTATIGYWQNRNGQNLIKSLHGGPTATQLGDWLAATFPNMYAALAGETNAEVAAFYKSLFAMTNCTRAGGGPPKLDAQVMATALAVYVTNQSLAGTVAAGYGFVVTAGGVGTRTYNVGTSGAAFGVANHAGVTVLDLLLAVNSRSRNGVLFDLDGDGDATDSLETNHRTLANNVFTGINEDGDI